MYFSRNSRYVLQRVRFLSPNFLSSSKKNLSVKKPKDDPTKPPLRINIPEEYNQTENFSKLVQKRSEAGETRSKSVIIKSKSTSFGAESTDCALAKSESEIQFSQLRFDETFINNNYDNEVASGETLQIANSQGTKQNKKDFKEGSQVVLNDKTTKRVFSDKCLNNITLGNNNFDSRRITEDEKKVTASNEMESDSNLQSLYIIIDVPQTNSEKNKPEVKDADASISASQEDSKVFSGRSRSSSFTSGANQEKAEINLSKKSKSFSRLNLDKTKLKLSKKFEVHEIEDAPTYIFHLKLNSNSWRKPCGVGWVPEKEISTRNENLNYNEPPIKIKRPLGSNMRGIGKEVTIVDQLPEIVRFSDQQKKQKLAETEKKMNLLGIDEKTEDVPFQSEPQPEPVFPSFGDPIEEKEKEPFQKAFYIKEERKKPQKFERDDFGTVRSVSKTYPFKLPLKSFDIKQEECGPQESASAAPTINEQSVFAETPSNTAAEETKTPKVQNLAHTASWLKVFKYKVSETTGQYTDQPISDAELMKSSTTDSYAQYVGKRQSIPTVRKKFKSTEFLSAYEHERKDIPNYNYEMSAKDQSTTNNDKNDEKLEYLSIHEKPAPIPLPVSVEISKKKSDTEETKVPKGVSKTKTKKPTKNPQNSKTPQKKLIDKSYQETTKITEFEKQNYEIPNFQPSARFVSITCEKIPSPPLMYSAAFPPLLKEALKSRFKFRKNFLFNSKWTKMESKSKDVSLKLSQAYEESKLSENSILFPKNENEEFDCESLFSSKEETALKIIKNSEVESSLKISENVAKIENESFMKNQDQPSVDSLTVMKKVKEIIQLDLDNAVKIFKNSKSESGKELSSVVILKENLWEVDTEELNRQVEMRGNQTKFDSFFDSSSRDNLRVTEGILGDKMETDIFKYLPSKEESSIVMNLSNDESDSVITFNPMTNEFFINKEALADAISRRTGEARGEVTETLDYLAKISKKSLDAKKGDSILVFDEDTQSWRVDFSILERREQELQLEKELTQRSELILETFEKLEKGQLSSVPKPESKDKKTFDYATEKWKVYEERNKANEKSTRSKSPFRESNAEEIRRKNSDLYEDLFVAKKKETAMTKSEKSAPGLDSSKTSKESKSASSGDKKEAADGSPVKSSGSTPKDPEPPKSDSKLPPIKRDTPIKKEDDNFWESFLKMNILPRDVRELPPPKPVPPTQPPAPRKPTNNMPKIEEPKSKTPEKKIEEPKFKTPDKKIDESKSKVPGKKIEEPVFKIPLPFTRKIDSKKPIDVPTSKEPKIKDEKKAPPPSAGITSEKKGSKEILDKKAPPPSGATSVSKEKIDKKAPPPTGATSGSKEKIDKKTPPSGAISGSKEKIDKKDPPSTGATSGSKDKIDKKAPPPPPSGATSGSKEKIDKKAPPPPPSGATSGSKEKIDKKAPPPTGATSGSKEKIDKKAPPPTEATSGNKEKIIKKEPPLSPVSTPKSDSKDNMKKSPTIGSSKPPIPAGKTPPSNVQSTKFPSEGKNDKKAASAADHYVSDKIIEMSKSKSKDFQTKIKTPKVETVKLNIIADKRLPSKITEINLNKKCEEKVKEAVEAPQNSIVVKKPSAYSITKADKSSNASKPFYKNLEKYKTPFSDPEYEENSTKIKSDIESNPNLNKLENWNKTLVLHDIMKPPENIESWLKDETDKMATLLLKILQETADGKPKKKASLAKSKSDDKNPIKGNPYENIRKKREVTPENFLFRVRTVNLSLENNKKAKPEVKVTIKQEKLKDMPVQSSKGVKAPDTEDPGKILTLEKEALAPTVSATAKGTQLPAKLDMMKNKLPETELETIVYPILINRDFAQQNKLPLEITEEIPGPEILKKISNAWKVFPILGSQMTIFTLFRVFQLVNLGNLILGNNNPERSRRSAFTKLFAKHGPIVNVQGPLSGNVILIYKPEHVTAVFEQDATIPVRSVFDSLEHSRRDLEERTYSANFSIDWTKPEWKDLKKGTTDPVFRGCEKYFRAAEMTGDSLINNIKKNRNNQNLVSEDFMEEIGRWSLEGLCSVVFEKSFGFLEGEGRTGSSWTMEPDKLFTAINKATECLSTCERGFQAWRLMSTRSMLGLARSYRTLSSIISKQLYQAEINLKNKNELLRDGILFPLKELTLIESMLLNDGMTLEEITCNLIDILLIGTNAMNSAMGFLLYNLAQNVRVQNKLLKELNEVFPHKNSRLDFDKLSSLKYLQACLKESLRLHLPVPIFYRMLQNDIILTNYIIPKGTYVIMDFRASCMKEQIFDDPDKFVPERWLGEEKWTHPFSSFPFCHGPKAELAKKVAEMQLLTCVAKIVRNFQIEYHFGEIQGTDSLVTLPNKPLKLNFIERKS